MNTCLRQVSSEGVLILLSSRTCFILTTRILLMHVHSEHKAKVYKRLSEWKITRSSLEYNSKPEDFQVGFSNSVITYCNNSAARIRFLSKNGLLPGMLIFSQESDQRKVIEEKRKANIPP